MVEIKIKNTFGLDKSYIDEPLKIENTTVGKIKDVTKKEITIVLKGIIFFKGYEAETKVVYFELKKELRVIPTRNINITTFKVV